MSETEVFSNLKRPLATSISSSPENEDVTIIDDEEPEVKRSKIVE